MSTKSTDTLRHEIEAATDIEDFLVSNEKFLLQETIPEYLAFLLKNKGLRKAEVIRNSLLDKSYVYQIFSGDRFPSRDKLIALAFGMKLNEAETQKLLKISGNKELYAREKRDAIILHCIINSKSLIDTNEVLYSYHFPPIGV